MELITMETGSGQMRLSVPGEWVRRSLLEGGEKLTALIEAVKELERFDFKYIVYPKLLKEREAEKRKAIQPEVILSPAKTHTHVLATISKKMQKKGILPYCLNCGETPNPQS